jgi:hypothetical protein
MRKVYQANRASLLQARLYCVGLWALSLAIVAQTSLICIHRGWQMGDSAAGKLMFASTLLAIDFCSLAFSAAAYFLTAERRWLWAILTACVAMSFIVGSALPIVEFRFSEILRALEQAPCSKCSWRPLEVRLARHFELELSEYVFQEQLALSVMFALAKPICLLAGIALWDRSYIPSPQRMASAPMKQSDEPVAATTPNSSVDIDMSLPASSKTRTLRRPTSNASRMQLRAPPLTGRGKAENGSRLARRCTALKRRRAKQKTVSGSPGHPEKQVPARWWQRVWRVLRWVVKSFRSAILRQPQPLSPLAQRRAAARFRGIRGPPRQRDKPRSIDLLVRATRSFRAASA